MSELWSGVLMALSAVCFGINRPVAGVVAGVAALFFRELAAPYVLVCVALAAGDRRYRELALWAAGLAAYAIFFALHVAQVLPRISGRRRSRTVHGWIRFGGAGFLISTAQMNAYLLLLPQWVTADLPGLRAGRLRDLEHARRPADRLDDRRSTRSLFSIAGNDFNQYWGSHDRPRLFCLAACRLPGHAPAMVDRRRFVPRSGENRLASRAERRPPESAFDAGVALACRLLRVGRTLRRPAAASLRRVLPAVGRRPRRRFRSSFAGATRRRRRAGATLTAAVDQVQRPAAHLVVDADHVLAQHADAQGVDRAEEAGHQHGRRPAGNGQVGEQPAEEREAAQAQRRRASAE